MLTQTKSTRQFLGEELGRRVQSNPRYSQRAFARHLGLSPGELSEVMRGKRDLSLRSTFKIARVLGLSASETRYLALLAQKEKGRKCGSGKTAALDWSEDGDEAAPQSHQLTVDRFNLVSDWTCFAILNLMECEGFRSQAAWIARRLGTSTAQVQLALGRLERVGVLTRKHGRWSAVSEHVASPSGIPSEAIRLFHRQMLTKAAESLELQPVSERDITGLGFSLDPKHLPAIRKDIQRFQDQLVSRYGGGRKSEVYHLEMALFRLTQTADPGGSHDQ